MQLLDNLALARPYAKALFELAPDAVAHQQWMMYFESVLNILKDPQSIAILRNKTVSTSVINDFLFEVFDSSAIARPALLKNFLNLLIMNQRLYLVSEIMDLYDQYYRRFHKILQVDYYSVLPLTDAEQAIVQEKLGYLFHKTIKISYQLDSALIGGYLIRVGDYVIDGSIIGFLEQFNQTLSE